MRKVSFKKIILAGGILLVMALVGGSVLWTQTYKTRVLDYLKGLVAENLNGTLTIDNVRFTPFSNGVGLTFSFENVSISDSLISEHNTPLLQAERVSATLDLDQLQQLDK